MIVRVKICGITRLEDALMAVDAGADALGFMFFEGSPRQVSFESAGRIYAALPPFITKVGVFVNPSAALVEGAIAECGIDVAQFHGDESPEFCRSFPLKAIKAFRIRDERSLELIPRYTGVAWLLDSFSSGQLGGTGTQFNWELARRAVKWDGKVILAGGLTPENVADAVRMVRPFAVDVSSGVEAAPGKKDSEKIRRFVCHAKGMAASFGDG
jgi:phosphoribosylanthranilate isomerase